MNLPREQDQVDRQALSHWFIRWSDAWQARAVQKAEDYRSLRPKPLTNAQLASLQNIVEAAPAYSDIRDYLRNQAGKADKAGPAHAPMKNYWLDMDNSLAALRQEAEQALAAVARMGPLNSKGKSFWLDEIHRRLARDYIQHLVAHCLYLTPTNKERDE